jgi:hypothetical protein
LARALVISGVYNKRAPKKRKKDSYNLGLGDSREYLTEKLIIVVHASTPPMT